MLQSAPHLQGVEPGAELADTDLHLPTVAEILVLPEVSEGRPTIEAGRPSLDRAVRWVHVGEISDIGHLLQGGELILSTGVAFPSTDNGLIRYIEELVAANAAGVMIELGRRFTSLPPALIERADGLALPLIALHTEVPFVAITEAIHSIIVNAQVRQLRLGEDVHRAFRSLAAEASSPQDIVQKVAQLAGCPVVFESPARHVLAFAGATTSGTEAIDHWDQRSRQASWAAKTALAEQEHWLTTPVGARGQIWGRLILLPREPATSLQQSILEQGATSLALHLLIERDVRLLADQTHRTLLIDIIERRYTNAHEIHVRAEALGVPIRRRLLIPIIIRTDLGVPPSDIAPRTQTRDEVAAVVQALSDVNESNLIGTLSPGRLGLLLSVLPDTRVDALLDTGARLISENLHKLTVQASIVIGVGTPVQSLELLHQSFAEADEAVDAAEFPSGERLYVTTADIRLRGLVCLLSGDPHLRRYADRQLGPLVEYDRVHRTDLVGTLAGYLEAGGNKSLAAAATHMSRATFYNHLARIEQALECDLEEPETQHSLYVALVTLRCLAGPGRGLR